MTTGGSPGMMHAIFVYRDEEHLAGIVNGDHMTLPIDMIGAYTVVAYQMPKPGACLFGTHDYDNDMVIMSQCGGTTTVSRFTVR